MEILICLILFVYFPLAITYVFVLCNSLVTDFCFKGSMKHLQVLQIPMTFLLQVACYKLKAFGQTLLGENGNLFIKCCITLTTTVCLHKLSFHVTVAVFLFKIPTMLCKCVIRPRNIMITEECN